MKAMLVMAENFKLMKVTSGEFTCICIHYRLEGMLHLFN